MAMARDIARAQKQAETARLRAVRENERQYRASLRDAERSQREHLKSLKEQAREEKQQYLEGRQEEAETLTQEVEGRISELSNVLSYTLSVNDQINFASLRIAQTFSPFKPKAQLARAEAEPVASDYFKDARAPSGWRKFLPGAAKRHERALKSAQDRFQLAHAAWSGAETERLAKLHVAESDHRSSAQAFEAKKATRNAEVDAFEAEYAAGDPNAIVSYCTMVLERSQYPDGFPQKFSIAFTQASKQLVVEYELPSIDIVPTATEYRYNRSQDDIVEKPRKPAEIKACYQDVIAAVTLRTIHEVFEAEHLGHIDVVCFNGYIHTVDPATGRDIQPHLISVRTTRERFVEIDLARADKRACLKNLGAQVSRSPEEAQPIKPIMEFKMADARFVDQTDLISGLSLLWQIFELGGIFGIPAERFA